MFPVFAILDFTSGFRELKLVLITHRWMVRLYKLKPPRNRIKGKRNQNRIQNQAQLAQTKEESLALLIVVYVTSLSDNILDFLKALQQFPTFSLDAETQICVWKWDTWDKQNTSALQIPAGRNSALAIRVQYQNDQIHFLVVHQIHLAIYETANLKRVKQWVVPKSSAHITDATLSSESEMIFASFLDATILIFGVANLQPVWRIQPSAYLHAISSPNVYPTAVDALIQQRISLH
ncbi:hypothetical protein MKW98_007718 [Papaver atlanticum]|uniref:Uncharacterized protein n=1 Tax=Papaver atlanticum TaxID=357466 RepID=A0AAD4S399_9MAGN|nr:hypothetical protein MKW98_007718 [Papaver atlanticum]